MRLFSHHQTCAHTGIGRSIPICIVGKRFCIFGNSQFFRPERQLFAMCTGTVPTGNKRIFPICNRSKGIFYTVTVCSAGWVFRWSAQHKIIVDEGISFGIQTINDTGKPFLNKRFFLCFGMNKNHISVAIFSRSNGFPCPGGLYFNCITVFLFKYWQ